MEKIILEYWSINSLKAYNMPLKKNDDCIKRMAEAITVYGFRVPIIATREGEIVDGELRYKAALYLALEKVPVIPAEDLSEGQIKAFRLLVNRSATWATWDFETVAVELATLKELDIPLDTTGFASKEIDKMLHSITVQGDKDPNSLPETPLCAVSCLGDVWLLGNHKLICGDATNLDHYVKLMSCGSSKTIANMVWTDPPYNVDYKGKAGKIKNDNMADEDFVQFLTGSFGAMAKNMRLGAAIYVAHADAGCTGLAFRKAFLASGFKLSSCLIWRKNQAVLSRADYHWQHEPILYGWLQGAAHKWHGNRKQSTIADAFQNITYVKEENGNMIWHVMEGERLLRITGVDVMVEEIPTSIMHAPKPQRSELHPTMKPVELIEGMIINSSQRGDIVLDPFGGSGSTLIACERLERSCRVIEMDPRFVDVIVHRWQIFTGREAIHEERGVSFATIETERTFEKESIYA